MQAAARQQYLETEVMTATPQKLQLLLIEAAIRHVQAAADHWQAAREESAAEALVRAQAIVSELLAGLNPHHDRQLCRRVAAVYMFVFRRLVSAHLEHDAQHLAEALATLQIERETWQEVCRRLGEVRPGGSAVAPAPAPLAETEPGGLSLQV